MQINVVGWHVQLGPKERKISLLAGTTDVCPPTTIQKQAKINFLKGTHVNAKESIHQRCCFVARTDFSRFAASPFLFFSKLNRTGTFFPNRNACTTLWNPNGTHRLSDMRDIGKALFSFESKIQEPTNVTA
jgi:hypothetical protein